MKAIVVHEKGGPEVLKYEDVPEPIPGPDEILIQTQAAGINFSDVGRRRNLDPADAPLYLGSEVAGPVLAVGPGVTEFQPGDYVATQGISGGYAEQAICRVRDAAGGGGSRDAGGRAVKVPAGVKPDVAVAVMLQALTAHAMAFGAYHLKPGDTVLVQAGAGGVGLMLTQLAKNAGATVYTTVGSDEKVAVSKEAGADVVINYSTDDFTARVMDLTKGAGVNAVFDAVGQATFMKGIACLAPAGTMVSYGAASGPVPPFKLSDLGGKGVYVTSTRMSVYTPTRQAWTERATEIMRLVEAGKLEARVTHYPLSRAADAHRDLEGRASVGKLVLVPD